MTDDDDIQDYVRPCQNCKYHRKRAQFWREEAYRQAGHPLPEREQEPVAFASHGVVNWIADKQFQHEAHLYSVPQRTWVGLTEAQCGVLWKTNMTPFEYYQAIEAKLKEKNT